MNTDIDAQIRELMQSAERKAVASDTEEHFIQMLQECNDDLAELLKYGADESEIQVFLLEDLKIREYIALLDAVAEKWERIKAGRKNRLWRGSND